MPFLCVSAPSHLCVETIYSPRHLKRFVHVGGIRPGTGRTTKFVVEKLITRRVMFTLFAFAVEYGMLTTIFNCRRSPSSQTKGRSSKIVAVPIFTQMPSWGALFSAFPRTQPPAGIDGRMSRKGRRVFHDRDRCQQAFPAQASVGVLEARAMQSLHMPIALLRRAWTAPVAADTGE